MEKVCTPRYALRDMNFLCRERNTAHTVLRAMITCSYGVLKGCEHFKETYSRFATELTLFLWSRVALWTTKAERCWQGCRGAYVSTWPKWFKQVRYGSPTSTRSYVEPPHSLLYTTTTRSHARIRLENTRYLQPICQLEYLGFGFGYLLPRHDLHFLVAGNLG